MGRGDLRIRPGARRGQERGCHLSRQGEAVARTYQMQHQVGGRRSPARCKAVAVNHPAVGDNIHLGVGGGEIFEVFPMHRGAVASQKLRACQNPSCRIYPAQCCKARGHAGQIADQGGGCHFRLAKACDHHQGIRPFGG